MNRQIEELRQAFDFYQMIVKHTSDKTHPHRENAMLGLVQAADELLRRESYILDLYEAQLLGYLSGRAGQSLVGLVGETGMSAGEWVDLKGKYGLEYLSEEEVREIEDYLGVPQ